MRLYTTVIEPVDPEIQEQWDKFSRSNGAIKRPFPKGPEVKVIATNIKTIKSKRWNPPRSHT